MDESRKIEEYPAPLVEVIEVATEAGFALTGDIEPFEREEW